MTKLLSMPLLLTICFTSIPSYATGWQDEDISDVHSGDSIAAQSDGVEPSVSAPTMCIDWFSTLAKLDLNIEQALIQLDKEIPIGEIHKRLYNRQAAALIPAHFEDFNASNVASNFNLIRELAIEKGVNVEDRLRDLSVALTAKGNAFSSSSKKSNCKDYSSAQIDSSAKKNADELINKINATEDQNDPNATKSIVDAWVKDKEKEIKALSEKAKHYEAQLLRKEIDSVIATLSNTGPVRIGTPIIGTEPTAVQYAVLSAKALKEQIIESSRTPLLDKFTGNDLIAPYSPTLSQYGNLMLRHQMNAYSGGLGGMPMGGGGGVPFGSGLSGWGPWGVPSSPSIQLEQDYMKDALRQLNDRRRQEKLEDDIKDILEGEGETF